MKNFALRLGIGVGCLFVLMGTAVDARGDEYLGELKGRIVAEWKLPTLERGSATAEVNGMIAVAEDLIAIVLAYVIVANSP